jgi:hypothetical protein
MARTGTRAGAEAGALDEAGVSFLELELALLMELESVPEAGAGTVD